ncbi:MAG TPA: adenylate/guanylate cyclase domain-containing protein [Gammaproteobacteria bacterium]
MAIETHENRAVLFADMSGSTKLYLTVGDDRAREIVAKTLERWSELTLADGGEVIQLRGDGMLCTFPSVDAALGAAVAMRDMPYEPALSMHAGIHAGPVQRDAEQLYGDAVNTAARMAEIAKRFEIVLSEEAQRQLANPVRWRNLRLIPKVPVKGKPEPMDIYLLPHDKHKLTDYRPPLQAKVRPISLHLRYGTTLVVVDASATSCLIGRDDECRMKIDHHLASRRHALIEYVSGKFFLQDHSTNGTYVTEAGVSEPALIQREIYQLKGGGAISLGIEPGLNPDHLITFSLGD